ncbi:MgtC/SapB family protein, partial [Staphylococcus condimenti]
VLSTLLALAIFVLMPRLERHTALRAARKRREANRTP